MVVRIAFEVGKQLALKEIKADSTYICKLIEDVFQKYKLKGEIKIIISPKIPTTAVKVSPNHIKRNEKIRNIITNCAVESSLLSLFCSDDADIIIALKFNL